MLEPELHHFFMLELHQNDGAEPEIEPHHIPILELHQNDLVPPPSELEPESHH
jgi:hypothetical protein